jgi:hypothetical protein
MDTDSGADPRTLVVAPVRHALTSLVVRGIALVGAIGGLAVWIVAAKPEATGRDGATFLAISLLAGYSIVVRAHRLVRGRPTPEEREIAWERAQEMDRDEAVLALMIVAWVPAAILVSLTVLLWPHLTDADPKTASAWVVFGVTTAVGLWLVMTATWLDAVRDDLARAEHEADLRFRSYWADLGR